MRPSSSSRPSGSPTGAHRSTEGDSRGAVAGRACGATVRQDSITALRADVARPEPSLSRMPLAPTYAPHHTAFLACTTTCSSLSTVPLATGLGPDWAHSSFVRSSNLGRLVSRFVRRSFVRLPTPLVATTGHMPFNRFVAEDANRIRPRSRRPRLLRPPPPDSDPANPLPQPKRARKWRRFRTTDHRR